VVASLLALVSLATRAREPAPASVQSTAVAHETAAAAALRRGEPIDLNTATAADLELLPHLGPALAARIVADRQRNGRFSRVEELDRVSGIGPHTVEQLAPLVRVASQR
jgi:competence protein ComEA